MKWDRLVATFNCHYYVFLTAESLQQPCRFDGVHYGLPLQNANEMETVYKTFAHPKALAKK